MHAIGSFMLQAAHTMSQGVAERGQMDLRVENFEMHGKKNCSEINQWYWKSSTHTVSEIGNALHFNSTILMSNEDFSVSQSQEL